MSEYIDIQEMGVFDCDPARLVEIEPGIWEMRFRHGDHEHGMRAMKTDKIPDPAKALQDAYRVTLRVIKEKRSDILPCAK